MYNDWLVLGPYDKNNIEVKDYLIFNIVRHKYTVIHDTYDKIHKIHKID